MITNYIELSDEEIKKLETIWNKKIKKIYSRINPNKYHRHETKIIFEDGEEIVRHTSSWRLETIINRKLNTPRIGGIETCDHIDKNCTNDASSNLRVLSFYKNSGNGFIDESIVLNILNLYYNKKISKNKICNIYKNINPNCLRKILNRETWKHVIFKIPENHIKIYENKIFTKNDIINILNDYYYNNKTINEISKNYNTNHSNIILIINRETWKHIPFKIPENFISNNGSIKFSNKIVLEILNDYYFNDKRLFELSKKYNIKISSIYDIVSRRTWKHIPFKIPENFDKKIKNDRSGENNSKSKLSQNQVLKIRRLYKTGKITIKKLSDLFKISESGIYDIISFKNWKKINLKLN